jgi:hypothetical protein
MVDQHDKGDGGIVPPYSTIQADAIAAGARLVHEAITTRLDMERYDARPADEEGARQAVLARLRFTEGDT